MLDGRHVRKLEVDHVQSDLFRRGTLQEVAAQIGQSLYLRRPDERLANVLRPGETGAVARAKERSGSVLAKAAYLLVAYQPLQGFRGIAFAHRKDELREGLTENRSRLFPVAILQLLEVLDTEDHRVSG